MCFSRATRPGTARRPVGRLLKHHQHLDAHHQVPDKLPLVGVAERPIVAMAMFV